MSGTATVRDDSVIGVDPVVLRGLVETVEQLLGKLGVPRREQQQREEPDGGD